MCFYGETLLTFSNKMTKNYAHTRGWININKTFFIFFLNLYLLYKVGQK